MIHFLCALAVLARQIAAFALRVLVDVALRREVEFELPLDEFDDFLGGGKKGGYVSIGISNLGI